MSDEDKSFYFVNKALENTEWVNINKQLPLNGQDIIILFRRREGYIWETQISVYRPYCKNGRNTKHPFGCTFQVCAWFPIPTIPIETYELGDTSYRITV
jgi:hypothetical protein